MTTRNPWMKFYPQDWAGDRKLHACSIAARGLWIEMMCIMHESDRYGHLEINGSAVTDQQLSTLAGIPSGDLEALLAELRTAGVFSLARKGVIYSRRMTCDAKKAGLAQENGKKGGNPKLCKQKGKPPQDKPQKPEARNQKPENKPPEKQNDNDILFFLGEVFEISEAEASQYRERYPKLQNLMADVMRADLYWRERYVQEGDEPKVLEAWLRKNNEDAGKVSAKSQPRLPSSGSMGARRYDTWTADEKEIAAVWINRGQSAYSCGLTPGHVDGLRKEGMLT